MRLKSGKRERAAILLAEDQLSDQQIANSIGVSRQSIVRWKKNKRFAERVAELNEIMCEQALKHGIARRETRVAVQHELQSKLLTVIAERAADAELQGVPGGKTGLVCKTVKGIGKGDDFRVVEVFETDTPTVKALLALHEQAAKEMGQIVERHEVADVSANTFKTDAELEAELVQILAKRTAEKIPAKPEDAPC